MKKIIMFTKHDRQVNLTVNSDSERYGHCLKSSEDFIRSNVGTKNIHLPGDIKEIVFNFGLKIVEIDE